MPVIPNFKNAHNSFVSNDKALEESKKQNNNSDSNSLVNGPKIEMGNGKFGQIQGDKD